MLKPLRGVRVHLGFLPTNFSSRQLGGVGISPTTFSVLCNAKRNCRTFELIDSRVADDIYVNHGEKDPPAVRPAIG